jgi:DNA-binding GntR family transcriptional regulator
MFKTESWDACADEVTVRKSALIELAEIAMVACRNDMEDITSEVRNRIIDGYNAKREQKFHDEYHSNIYASCSAKRMVEIAANYQKAIDAYVHLRMIDSQGENRTLKLID